MRLFLFLLLPALAFGQATKFENVPNRDGLLIGHNRFKGESYILTKRAAVVGRVGKSSFFDSRAGALEIFAAATFKDGRQIKEVMIAISPEPKTFRGSLLKDGHQRRLYIPFDSELLAIADGKRLDLGATVKALDFDSFGQYDGAGYVMLSVESFTKIAAANRLELALGNIEIEITKQLKDRLKALADEIATR